LHHSAMHSERKMHIEFIQSEDLEPVETKTDELIKLSAKEKALALSEMELKYLKAWTALRSCTYDSDIVSGLTHSAL
jgi:hypothetical protein